MHAQIRGAPCFALAGRLSNRRGRIGRTRSYRLQSASLATFSPLFPDSHPVSSVGRGLKALQTSATKEPESVPKNLEISRHEGQPRGVLRSAASPGSVGFGRPGGRCEWPPHDATPGRPLVHAACGSLPVSRLEATPILKQKARRWAGPFDFIWAAVI
jgi:hypothetical protein